MKNGTETNISQPDYIGEWVKGRDQQKRRRDQKNQIDSLCQSKFGNKLQ